MPWIALYIAAASLVCTLAMAADIINGFRQKMLWFPSKYFSVTATSLTLLAVAMKLPTDLNTNLFYQEDWFSKLTGLIFMSTAMGVALYRKWHDVDLRVTSYKCKNFKNLLQELSSKAERTVMEFKREVKVDLLMENPLNWPVKVIAANSMYRVSRTILLAYIGEKQVLQLLHQREWPSLDADKATYIEEWHSLFQQDTETPALSTSTSIPDRIVQTNDIIVRVLENRWKCEGL
ncbi:hypothetical protein BUALT_Bualt07G0076600 [Buddleja alternifolia]|uniref:Uncharacterized protein n=1 Tax=Buddleja alternifolia TaxID=168488 RepID=A0AAV6XDG3_9LAMI|nr:hypothetical protein BUALT_Bualt07G0076600 [Buddleja alternifolia]